MQDSRDCHETGKDNIDFKWSHLGRGLGIMRPFLIANMMNLAIRLSVALICAPRFGIVFVWLAVPAGWFANFLISYAALWHHGRLIAGRNPHSLNQI